MSGIKDQLGKFIFSRLQNTNLRAENLKAIQEMATSSYLGDHVSICKVLGRFHCFIDTRDRTFGAQLLTKGFWEIQNTECIAKRVKKDMTVIDIGANFGYFTLLMCGLVGNDNGKVYSIEANPNIFQFLNDTMCVNGQLSKVELFNCAIYKEPCDDLNFIFRNNSPMNGHLYSHNINPENLKENENLIKVKGNTLDKLIPENEKIDFIKVDIEGAEEMFWHGSKRIRQDNTKLKILMEFNPKRYENPQGFVHSVVDEGYQITLIGKSEDYNQVLNANELLKIPSETHVMILLEKI
ncbi:FkbM family methyltransferase [Marinicella gelatinilytica]|uniref:FkbM family methyltransferase n=1 Tax=Marinicella gelatinilytica TaxID=2996017 RepID=UPI002260BC48|nr:FkbM family methyltransferase [Marinicella gelatinilytica]MCX7545257.1 FkbM family methyltransferase [Marinicella gelatinilytica]